MKIRLAHPHGVTKRAVHRALAALTGLAALALAFLPSHAAQAQTIQGAGTPVAGGDHLAVQPGFRHMIAAVRQQSDAALLTYKVPAGGSISEAAVKECHGQAKDWTGIFAASRKMHLTGPNANVVNVGQLLAIDCQYIPSQLKFAGTPQPHWHPHTALAMSGGGGGNLSYGHPNFCGDGDGDGWDVPCQAASPSAVPHFHRAAAAASSSGGSFGNVNPANYSGFQQCVISRESGGNSQVMNSSGHYGLYQFSEGTWVAYGGVAGDFGHASSGEQTQVFNNAMAKGGQSNWSPYDGC